MEENDAMKISREDLFARYASLSNAELFAIDRNELTGLAQQCYDHEVKQRHFSEEIESDDAQPEVEARDQVAADWHDTAIAACSFQVGTGRRYAEDAERACTILRDAGIPCRVVAEHEDGAPDFLSVMVPGAVSLKANSVLDRDLFNEELEETWRTHFEQLSDDELRVLNADDLSAGLLDRAARLKRIYQEALMGRKSGVQPS